MDKQDAAQRALKHINRSFDHPTDSLVLLDEETLDRSYGWVFFYQSKNYVETGRSSSRLAGNGPIVVLRSDGSIHELGTANPLEDEIAAFERERGFKS
jgi:hypothetical protein